MKIFIIAFWLAELIGLVFYIKSCWPTRTRKSMYLKILVSTIFLVYGILLSVFIRYGYNVSFAGLSGGAEQSAAANTFFEFTGGGLTVRVVHLMIAGLAYGWLGDLFLGLAHQVKGAPSSESKNEDLHTQLKTKKAAFNGLGVLAFLLGHVLYCVAFGRAIYGYEFSLHWWSIAFFLLPFIGYAYIGIHFNLRKHLVPLFVYFAALSAMFGLAMTLGIQLWAVYKPFAICLIAGSLLFALSDLGLSLETYGGEKFKKFALRAPRQVAYFVGQMLLATTILYFYTV